MKINQDYLIPTLAKTHPGVEVYIGTFNTNRQDYVEKILAGLPAMSGIGFQWEGREILPAIRAQYPAMRFSAAVCGSLQNYVPEEFSL